MTDNLGGAGRLPWAHANTMKKPLRLVILVSAFIFGSIPISSRDALQIRVSPVVSRAPALLTVRAMIEPSADNRSLQIIAASNDFFRSSEVSLDGTNSSPLNVFEFRNLPTGMYQVTAVLVGVHGPRGTVSRLAKVEPAVGGSH